MAELVAHIGDDRGAHADPDAGRERDRVAQGCGLTSHPPPGAVTGWQGQQHGRRQPVDAAALLIAGVREHDVEREQPGVGEGQAELRARPPRKPDVDQHVDAGDGSWRARRRWGASGRLKCGERDHRQELDRRHRAERQARDRLIEAAVHDRGGLRGERHQQADRVAVGRAHGAPWAAPGGEYDRRARRCAARPRRAAPRG